MSESYSTSLLSRPEKEKKVIELLKQGKTFSQIAKELHISFGDITRIKRNQIAERESGKSEQNSNNTNKKPKSIDSQAFLMFSAGKTPVEVAIVLDLSTNEVEKLSKDYWLLKGLRRLPATYDSIKKDLPHFFRLYHVTKANYLKNGDILKVLEYADKITILDKEVENLEKQRDDLVFERGDKLRELQLLMNRITESKQELSKIEKEKQNRESDVLWLHDEIYEKGERITTITSSNKQFNSEYELALLRWKLLRH